MQKAHYLLIIIVVYANIGCSVTNKSRYTDYKAVEDEPLIRIFTKNMKSGAIEFIVKNEDQISLTQFSYYIDVDKKEITCHKSVNKVIDDSTDEYLTGLWMTSDMFKHNETNSQKQSYWKCFSEDFNDKSNADKIKLLEDLSKRRHDYLIAFDWLKYPIVTENNIQMSGVDNSPYMNTDESKLLNASLIDSTVIDFSNKKVLFLNDLSLGSKTDYFEMFKQIYNKETNVSIGKMANNWGYWYVFNEKERTMLDNYDAVIVYRPKRPYKKEKIIKAIKKHIKS